MEESVEIHCVLIHREEGVALQILVAWCGLAGNHFKALVERVEESSESFLVEGLEEKVGVYLAEELVLLEVAEPIDPAFLRRQRIVRLRHCNYKQFNLI